MSSSDQDNHDNQNSKPKWTGGPWWVGPTPHYLAMGQIHRGVHPITIRSNEHTEEIATVWTCLLPTDANAHLIAAAPELYEALWEVLDGLGALSNPSELYGYGYDDDWPEKILNVLAKARRETS